MKMDAINEWGSVLALTYIAAQRVFPDYNDMADNKAVLESIARNFGYYYGTKKHVRVNTVFHDGGFSFTGVTQAVIEQMEK